MAGLDNLADVARRTGYPVVEIDGWRTRGRRATAACADAPRTRRAAGRSAMPASHPASGFAAIHRATIFEGS